KQRWSADPRPGCSPSRTAVALRFLHTAALSSPRHARAARSSPGVRAALVSRSPRSRDHEVYERTGVSLPAFAWAGSTTEPVRTSERDAAEHEVPSPDRLRAPRVHQLDDALQVFQ